MGCFHGSPDSDSSLNMTHHYARFNESKIQSVAFEGSFSLWNESQIEREKRCSTELKLGQADEVSLAISLRVGWTASGDGMCH